MPNLDSLPSELHFKILSHHTQVNIGAGRLARHPFLALSTLCKPLRDAVESYCHHLLQASFALDGATRPSIPAPPFTSEQKPTYRQVFLINATRRCRYCNCSTKSTATGDDSIRCCRRCNRLKPQPSVMRTPAELEADAAAEYGIPPDVLRALLPDGIASRDDIIKIATEIHKKRGVTLSMFLEARTVIKLRAQQSFMSTASALYMEQQARLLALRAKRKQTLTEPEMKAEIASRRNKWDLQCEAERRALWKEHNPWCGDIAMENEEVYKYIAEAYEKKRGREEHAKEGE